MLCLQLNVLDFKMVGDIMQIILVIESKFYTIKHTGTRDGSNTVAGCLNNLQKVG